MGTNAKEDQAANSKTESDVYVGGGTNPHKQSRSAKKLALVLAVLVLLVAGAGMWAYDHHKDSAKVASKPFVPFPKTPQSDAEDIVNSYLNQADQTPAALQASVDKLTALWQGAKTNDDKEAYASAIIELYSRLGNYNAALPIAIQANNMIQSASASAQLAGVYKAQGDYAHAAEYYKLAVSRSPKTSAKERSPYNDYLAEQKQMEARL